MAYDYRRFVWEIDSKIVAIAIKFLLDIDAILHSFRACQIHPMPVNLQDRIPSVDDLWGGGLRKDNHATSMNSIAHLAIVLTNSNVTYVHIHNRKYK